jgi:hypothetical protein
MQSLANMVMDWACKSSRSNAPALECRCSFVGWVRYIAAIAGIYRNPTIHRAMLGYAIANPTYNCILMRRGIQRPC